MSFERDNGNVHRAAANIIVSKGRAARGSVCIALLCRDLGFALTGCHAYPQAFDAQEYNGNDIN